MKKQLCIVAFALLFSTIALGQQKTKIPKWISDKGYWQIESNIKTPKSHVIYFFNNNNEIVYQEKMEGVKINLNRRKILMRLKGLLDQALLAWENGNKNANNLLVATAFKK